LGTTALKRQNNSTVSDSNYVTIKLER